jgi:hypothetical protein
MDVHLRTLEFFGGKSYKAFFFFHFINDYSENSNSIPAAFWSIVHTIQNPELLARTRSEAETCRSETSTGQSKFDSERLCRKPLLQSVWSEVLRMYVALFIVRGSDHDDFALDKNWTIGKGKMIVVDTHQGHHDSNVWNEGEALGSPVSFDPFLESAALTATEPPFVE